MQRSSRPHLKKDLPGEGPIFGHSAWPWRARYRRARSVIQHPPLPPLGVSATTQKCTSRICLAHSIEAATPPPDRLQPDKSDRRTRIAFARINRPLITLSGNMFNEHSESAPSATDCRQSTPRQPAGSHSGNQVRIEPVLPPRLDRSPHPEVSARHFRSDEQSPSSSQPTDDLPETLEFGRPHSV